MFTTTTVYALLGAAAFINSTASTKGYDFVLDTDPHNPRARLIRPSVGELSGLLQFTACAYIKVDSEKIWHTMTLFSYSSEQTGNDNELVLEFNVLAKWVAIYIYQRLALFQDVELVPGEWTHMCVSREPAGRIQLYVDAMAVGVDADLYNRKKLGGKGHFVLGQDQDYYDSYYSVNDGYSGRISDFNLWNEALSDEQVGDAASCELEGNVISWGNSTWGFYDNMMILPSDSPCAPSCETPER